MPGIHLRTDQPLHSQLTAIARAENLSLNAYLVRLVRADVNRRQRLAASVQLDWRATDAELADALGTALATPLSDIEQHGLKGLTPEQAVGYAAARAAKKRTSKPAPSAGTKPPPAPSSKHAPSSGTKPAAQTRSKAPAKRLITAEEYDDLLALRAKRAGKPAPPRGASKGMAAYVTAAEFDELIASRSSAKRGGK